MPKFSVLIAAYDVEKYLPACLASLSGQTYPDFEAVVVDDASTDSTPCLIGKACKADRRFTVVTHQRNKGLHLTRMRGVEEARGDYVMFLDPDDTLEQGFLGRLQTALEQEGDPDVLHYGIRVVTEDSGLQGLVQQFEGQSNRPFPPLVGPQALVPVFEHAGGYERDWRTTQRAFRRELIGVAFAAMSHERLERAEDAYEYLVVASMLGRECTCNDLVGYVYHMGRGVTNSRGLTVEEFGELARAYRGCVDAARAFALADGRDCVSRACEGLVFKLYETVGNDWNSRVDPGCTAQAAHLFADACGAAAAAAQVARCGRDAAWAVLQGEAGREAFERAELLEGLDHELVSNLVIPENDPYWEFERPFASHMADVRRAHEQREPEVGRVRRMARALVGAARRLCRGDGRA